MAAYHQWRSSVAAIRSYSSCSTCVAFPADGHQRQRAYAGSPRRRPAAAARAVAPGRCWRGSSRGCSPVFVLMILGSRNRSPPRHHPPRDVGRRLVPAHRHPRLRGAADRRRLVGVAVLPALPRPRVAGSTCSARRTRSRRCWWPTPPCSWRWPACGGWPAATCRRPRPPTPSGSPRSSPAPSRSRWATPTRCSWPAPCGRSCSLEERRPVAARLAALVATASRPNGFVVVDQPRRRRGRRAVAGPRPASGLARSSPWSVGPSVVFLAVWMARLLVPHRRSARVPHGQVGVGGVHVCRGAHLPAGAACTW